MGRRGGSALALGLVSWLALAAGAPALAETRALPSAAPGTKAPEANATGATSAPVAGAEVAQAQPTTPAPAATPAAREGGIEVIIVTAEKREASVQDVPISITALSGEGLNKLGINSTELLANVTPGLLVQRSVVGKISIRGVGNENYTIAGDPGVAVHSDGIYVARASAGLFDLFDVERIEVLRGPQGTLYGRNATGGVINIIPNRPTDDYEGRLYAEYGSYNNVRLEGVVSGPITDGVKGRLALMGNRRDGFTQNLFPGADARGVDELDTKDVLAVRGQLEFDNGSPFTARIMAEYIRDDSNLPAYKYITNPLPPLVAGGINPPGLRNISQGFELEIPGSGRSFGTKDDIFKTNQLGIGVHLNYDFGWATLTSITGYRKTAFNWLNDGDGVDLFVVNYGQQDSTNQWSQELRLASNNPGSAWQWLVGGYFFRETGDSFIALPFPFGFGLPFYIVIDGVAETTAFAGFGEVNWKPIDRLTLTFGARYSREKRSTTYRYEINFGVPFIRTPDLEDTFGAFTPKVAINYALTDSINVYASATRGFKSGGFNLLAVQPGFEPELVWAYEAGIKSLSFDDRLQLNGNFFYYSYKDMQVDQIVNLQSVLTNAGKSTIYGIEIEAVARPTDQLELTGQVSWLHAEFDEFCTGDPTQPAAPIDPGCTAQNPIDLSGNRLRRTPKFTLSGSAAYTIPFANGSALRLQTDARYQSQMYFTQFNRPEVSQSGYTVMNVRASWTSPDERWELAVFGKNVLDKDYFTELLESGAFNPTLVVQGYVGAPRTWGGSVAYKF